MILDKVLVGDCFKVLPTLEAESVDLCVTSPPYWGLRDYGSDPSIWGGVFECQHEWGENIVKKQSGGTDKADVGNCQDDRIHFENTSNFCIKCGAWRGAFGLEPHPKMFIDHLVEFGRLVRQVLKPSGLFWLNLGDTYYGSWGNYGAREGKQRKCDNPSFDRRGATSEDFRPPMAGKSNGKWLQPKQLLMIPSRVACALQDDGWILRSDVIWHKPNHMPESVTDRFTKSYEHFYTFSKEQRYYFNLDEIREKYAPQSIARLSQPSIMSQMGGEKQESLHGGDPGNGNRPADILKGLSKRYSSGNKERKLNHQPGDNHNGRSVPWVASEGKNPGDVWKSANTGENNKDPYQGNNPHLQRITKGLDDAQHPNGKNPGDVWEINTQPFPGSHFAVFPEKIVKRIIKCSSPPQGVVLDPFAGSGTTLRVARKLGRKFIRIELNPEYAEMAEQRIKDRDFRKVEQVNKL